MSNRNSYTKLLSVISAAKVAMDEAGIVIQCPPSISQNTARDAVVDVKNILKAERKIFERNGKRLAIEKHKDKETGAIFITVKVEIPLKLENKKVFNPDLLVPKEGEFAPDYTGFLPMNLRPS